MPVFTSSLENYHLFFFLEKTDELGFNIIFRMKNSEALKLHQTGFTIHSLEEKIYRFF